MRKTGKDIEKRKTTSVLRIQPNEIQQSIQRIQNKWRKVRKKKNDEAEQLKVIGHKL